MINLLVSQHALCGTLVLVKPAAKKPCKFQGNAIFIL